MSFLEIVSIPSVVALMPLAIGGGIVQQMLPLHWLGTPCFSSRLDGRSNGKGVLENPPSGGSLFVSAPPPNEVQKGTAYKPSFIKRWVRRWYARDYERVVEQKRYAVGFWNEGRRTKAGEAELRFGTMLWDLSACWGIGQWSEAEAAWITGAMILTNNTPSAPVKLNVVPEDAVSLLKDRNIVGDNPWKGVIDGDDYLVSRWVGVGTHGTVKKVFGKAAATKVFDGGLTKFMDPGVSYAQAMGFDVGAYVRAEAGKLEGVAALGLGAARVYGFLPLDVGFVRELVDGVTLGNLEHVLELDEITPALEAVEEYRARLAEGGFTDYDGFLAGNIVYTQSRNWVMIDY